MSKIFYYILIIGLSFIPFANAEDIDLTADQKVEWHQKEQKMVAIGNAVVTKKDLKVKADEMTAFYEKVADNNKTQITTVHAKGHVKMSSNKADAFGDTLDYELSEDKMILKGNPAKIKTDTETITAKESITYYPSQDRAIALGNVEATNQKDKIFSDKMIAYFEKTSPNDSSLVMNKVEIFGNIKILTSNSTVWADRGEYLPKTGLVKLYENVTLEQDGNKLKGEYAESDLNTGISRIQAGKTSGKRVTGVFIEKSKEKKEEQPLNSEPEQDDNKLQ